VTDQRRGTKPGAVLATVQAAAEDIIAGWIRDLTESGSYLVDSTGREKLTSTVVGFMTAGSPEARLDELSSLLPNWVLQDAAQSLADRLRDETKCPDSAVRRLLLGACAKMRSASEKESRALWKLTKIAADAASNIQRATSPVGAKRKLLEAVVELCEASRAVWWDQEIGPTVKAAATQGIQLKGRANKATMPESLWEGHCPREGIVELSTNDKDHRELLKRIGARNGVLVQGRYGNQWLAVIGVYEGHFRVERLDLLTMLVQQTLAVVQALTASAHHKEMARDQRRSISELGFALSSALSLDELLDLICRSAMELGRAEDCVVFLQDGDNQEFRARAVSRAELEVPGKLASRTRELAEQARAQPPGKAVWRTGRGLGVSIRDAGYGSVLAVPLSIRGDPIGALILLSSEARPVGAVQREFMNTFAAQAAITIENIQLIEDMQRRLLEMADLTWVSTRITSTMDIEKIAATVADAVSKALDLPRAALLLVNEDGEYAPVPQGQRGIGAANADRLPSSGHLAHDALSLGVPQSVTDSTGEGHEADVLVKWLGVRSLLCVPMVAQQGLRGVLVVGDERPRDFPSHAVALLSAYANQTALALQSAMLYQDVVRHLHQLENLFEVSRTLASSLELTETLERVLDAAADLLEAPVATLFLKDVEADELAIKAARGLEPDHDFYRPLKVGEGLAGRAAQSGKALSSADVRKDGRFVHRAHAREGGLKAGIAAPLITRGRTVGVINLYRRSDQEFDEEDERLVMALAHSAAVAIENARLYEETQERAQFLTAMVSEINHRVRNTLQAVAGLLRMEMEHKPPRTMQEVLRRGIARLQSVAVVHDMLQARDLRFVDIKQATRRIVQITSQTAEPDSEIETRVTGARVMLPSQQAANVAMILSELIDNAVRHGLAESDGGRILVSLADAGGNVVLEVKDSGVGLPSGFDLQKDAGLGLKVVRGLIEDELGGCLDVESDKGVTVRVKFPKHR